MKVATVAMCALAFLAPSSPPQDAAARAERIGEDALQRTRFPTPPHALSLTWQGDGPLVTALLDAYARATERTVLVAQDTLQVVSRQLVPVDPGTGSLDVRPEDVHEVFETLLRASDLLLLDLFDCEGSSAVQVVSLRTQDRNEVRRRAIRQPVADIETYRKHPAVLVTTWVPVAEATGVVSLSLALRAAITEPTTQSLALAGGGIALTGRGPDVCRIVDFVREMDALHLGGEVLDMETLRALVSERFPQPVEKPK